MLTHSSPDLSCSDPLQWKNPILQCHYFLRHCKKTWRNFGPRLSLYRNFLSQFEDEYVKADSTGKYLFKVWRDNIRIICHMLCKICSKLTKLNVVTMLNVLKQRTASIHVDLMSLLTHFSPIFHFYDPWKRQKTFSFLTFSGGVEVGYWAKI